MDMEQPATLSPIAKLPTEVFGRVLQHYLSEVLSFQRTIDNPNIVRAYYRRLRDLSLVCRRWAMFVNESPSLWTTISAQMPRDFLQLCMVKPGYHSIDLECSSADQTFESYGLPGRISPDIQTFWDTVRPHFSRCRTAYIRWPLEDWDVAVDPLKEPASRLKSLTLVPECWFDEDSPPFQLLKGEVMNIETLELYAAPLDWFATSLRGLTFLTLDRLAAGPPTAAMVNIIKDCPDIEFLRLDSISCDSEPAGTGGRWSPTIDLPRLRTLIISYITLPQTEAVLRSIKSIPRCTKFNVEANFWEHADDELFSVHDTLQHLIPDFQRISQIDKCEEIPGPHLCINFTSMARGFKCLDSSSAFKLHIAGPNTFRFDAIRFVTSLIEGVNVQVSLLVDDDGIIFRLAGPESDLELLQATQNLPVTRLHLRSLRNWSGWFTYLSSLHQHDERSFPRPFRNMTQLLCDEDIFQRNTLYQYAEDVLAMVFGRYSGTDDAAAQVFCARGPEHTAPVSLTKFTYDGHSRMDAVMPEILDGILGCGVFEVLTEE